MIPQMAGNVADRWQSRHNGIRFTILLSVLRRAKRRGPCWTVATGPLRVTDIYGSPTVQVSS